MMLDTETTNDIECPLCYDVGYQVFEDSNGLVLAEASMVNADIFCDKELMASAFFADKIPIYWEEIKMGARELMAWSRIKWRLFEAYVNYNCAAVCAHNARFDYRSLHNTQRYITTSQFRYVLPWGAVWLDTLKMARNVLKDDEAYKKFCVENEYLTANNQPKMTAEVLYRYITGKNDFDESHTALEDVRIEKLIYFYCISRDPAVDGKLW
jgi:hypothetical protein